MSERIELELSLYGTTTIEGLIAGLLRCEADAEVQFDFCYLAPTTLDSYRGYYDHLALGWEDPKAPAYWPKVTDLRDKLVASYRRTYEGWKGGTYTMRPNTPLWVANRGESGGTGIIGIEADSSTVVLVTARVD